MDAETSAHSGPIIFREPSAPATKRDRGNGAAARESVGETMATNEDHAGADAGQPVKETDHQVDMRRAGMTAHSRSRSFLHGGFSADAAVEPAARGYDRSLWPDLQ